MKESNSQQMNFSLKIAQTGTITSGYPGNGMDNGKDGQ